MGLRACPDQSLQLPFHHDDKQNPLKWAYRLPKSGRFNLGRVGGSSARSSKVFSEEHEPWRRKRILDPGSEIVLKWNRVFLLTCLVALFVDPLYFYLPSVGHGNDNSSCIKLDQHLSIVVTSFRTIADFFYLLHMFIKFRTAYVAPSSRVFGRGELVMDPKKIARRYIRSDFAIDLVAALPLPQVLSHSLWSTLRPFNY
uniref:Putative cyclic nucleotide-gated ion channel 17 n=1 Tax=Anthurium amnicola TaxID=1678845 RepID=A0A1D1XFK8_9ARAE